MMRIRISEEAIQDLNDGFLFYEAQEPGLGEYFARSLTADIDYLKSSAGIHRIVYRDYHRLLSKRFPYGIFYTLEGEVVVVWAILDLRKDPAWIQAHLQR